MAKYCLSSSNSSSEETLYDPDLKPEDNMKSENHAPITSSYNSRIRPLLDAVDKLRNLRVTSEGIQLPTIVVVGDQSSGKSSVLESLAGISLPRGQGICTRVPLIIRLQHHLSQEPELSLEFNDQVVQTKESCLSDAINAATERIAGSGKGISNTPITLVVKKDGVPDLTMVDLPGITRVPVQGQPENIYEQIAEMIMNFIRPEESIILNVLSATVDFSTCESIRMSQQVDKMGQRTLAVVTKCDKAPEGLFEKVIADDVKIGLGYVCVRNRIGDETYKVAREEEAKLFANHQQLSKIDKSMVGIPVLAQKLVQIQGNIISRCFPDIVKNINGKLAANISELNKMPKGIASVAEAMTAFMGIIGATKDSLRKLLIRGEFDEYPDDKSLHCTARMVEMLDQFSNELHSCAAIYSPENFLQDEVNILDEVKEIQLPNFLSRSAFLTIMHSKFERISRIPATFVEKVWTYIEEVVMIVLQHHSANYHLLNLLARRAGQALIADMKEQSMFWVSQVVEMERLTDYTCNPEYMSLYNKLMEGYTSFANANSYRNVIDLELEGFGKIDLKPLKSQQQPVLHQAFDLKMRMTAYWNIVLMRLVDYMALQVQLSIYNLVNKEMEKKIVSELMNSNGVTVEAMLEESPLVAAKREKLKTTIGVLKQSKEILATIMNKFATMGI